MKERGEPHENRWVELSDGRRLWFAEYGPEDGSPLLLFHGIPGSRLSFRFGSSDNVPFGRRLLCPERPGCGRSTWQPNRLLLDWPKDIEELCRHLRIKTVDVLGVSGGAPYALACARSLRNRVRTTAIVSGMGPVDDKVLLERASRGQRTLLRLFRDTPGFAGALSFVGGGLLRGIPRSLWCAVARRLPRPDREGLFRADFGFCILEPLREAFSQGCRGVSRDLWLMTQPWGFSLEEVDAPILWWHGERDRDVPLVVARRAAERLSCCRARWIPGAGHLWIVSHFKEVLERLTSGAPRNQVGEDRPAT